MIFPERRQNHATHKNPTRADGTRRQNVRTRPNDRDPGKPSLQDRDREIQALSQDPKKDRTDAQYANHGALRVIKVYQPDANATEGLVVLLQRIISNSNTFTQTDISDRSVDHPDSIVKEECNNKRYNNEVTREGGAE